MPPKRDPRGKQASVTPKDPEEMGESSGEADGEVVPTADLQTTLIPGFSNEQVNGLMTMISAMMDARWKHALDILINNVSNPILSPQSRLHTTLSHLLGQLRSSQRGQIKDGDRRTLVISMVLVMQICMPLRIVWQVLQGSKGIN